MNINEKNCEQQPLLISKLSIISFVLAVSSYVLLIFVLIFNTYLKTLMEVAPLIMIFFLAVSFILSIIDLRSAHRKRILSIIALILSSLYFLFIVGTIIFLVILR